MSRRQHTLYLKHIMGCNNSSCFYALENLLLWSLRNAGEVNPVLKSLRPGWRTSCSTQRVWRRSRAIQKSSKSALAANLVSNTAFLLFTLSYSTCCAFILQLDECCNLRAAISPSFLVTMIRHKSKYSINFLFYYNAVHRLIYFFYCRSCAPHPSPRKHNPPRTI